MCLVPYLKWVETLFSPSLHSMLTRRIRDLKLLVSSSLDFCCFNDKGWNKLINQCIATVYQMIKRNYPVHPDVILLVIKLFCCLLLGVKSRTYASLRCYLDFKRESHEIMRKFIWIKKRIQCSHVVFK